MMSVWCRVPGGCVRSSEETRRHAGYAGQERQALFLSHLKAVEAFDRYVGWRYRHGHGVSLDRREYRGLMPRSRLLLTQKGGPFELSLKRRVSLAGEPRDIGPHIVCKATSLVCIGPQGQAGVQQSFRAEDVRNPVDRQRAFARNRTDSIGACLPRSRGRVSGRVGAGAADAIAGIDLGE